MQRSSSKLTKIIFFHCLILIIFYSAISHAGKLDPQIDAVQKAYRNAADISTDFTQRTFVLVLDKTMTKKGRMYFKKGGKFRIEYDGKREKRYISDGDTLWVFVPGDASSMVTYEVSDDTVPREALKFLSNFDNLKKDFKVEKSDAFSHLKDGESALYLEPKSKKAHFKALDAKFSDRNILTELKIHNKSGNITDYDFSNIRTSTGLKDSLFKP
jgi:outer membrane lipoprotein-sorting protein